MQENIILFKNKKKIKNRLKKLFNKFSRFYLFNLFIYLKQFSFFYF